MRGVVLERDVCGRRASTAAAETCVTCDICTRAKDKGQDVAWETKE